MVGERQLIRYIKSLQCLFQNIHILHYYFRIVQDFFVINRNIMFIIYISFRCLIYREIIQSINFSAMNKFVHIKYAI